MGRRSGFSRDYVIGVTTRQKPLPQLKSTAIPERSGISIDGRLNTPPLREDGKRFVGAASAAITSSA